MQSISSPKLVLMVPALRYDRLSCRVLYTVQASGDPFGFKKSQNHHQPLAVPFDEIELQTFFG